MIGMAGSRGRDSARALWVAFGLPLVVWLLSLLTLPIDARRSTAGTALLAAVAAAGTGMILRRQRRRAPHRLLARTDEDAGVAAAVATGAVVLVGAAIGADVPLRPLEVVVGTAASLLVLLGVHGVARVVHRRGASAPSKGERVVIVGVGPEARELVDLLNEQPAAGIRIIGVVGDSGVAQANGLQGIWLAGVDDLLGVMMRHCGTSVLITATGFRGPSFREITDAVLDAGYEVLVFNTVSRVSEARVSVRSLMHEPLIAVRPHRVRQWTLAWKRALDLILAGVLLVLSAPVLGLAALAVKLEDGGPVLFRQERVGRDGRGFTILKVRSMRVGADADRGSLLERNERTGPLFKISHDPRVTRVGRIIRATSIDELPQLVNVLRGEMSLVGPRPALSEEVRSFDEHLRRRLAVRPGVTGLWQVEARTSPSFAAYQRLDLHYCENWTIGLDLRILLASGELFLTELLIGVGSALRLVVDGGTPVQAKPIPTPIRQVERE